MRPRYCHVGAPTAQTVRMVLRPPPPRHSGATDRHAPPPRVAFPRVVVRDRSPPRGLTEGASGRSPTPTIASGPSRANAAAFAALRRAMPPVGGHGWASFPNSCALASPTRGADGAPLRPGARSPLRPPPSDSRAHRVPRVGSERHVRLPRRAPHPRGRRRRGCTRSRFLVGFCAAANGNAQSYRQLSRVNATRRLDTVMVPPSSGTNTSSGRYRTRRMQTTLTYGG